MAMKVTSLHLDTRDIGALARIAKAETQRTGIRVTASSLVRRLIRQYLDEQKGAKP